MRGVLESRARTSPPQFLPQNLHRILISSQHSFKMKFLCICLPIHFLSFLVLKYRFHGGKDLSLLPDHPECYLTLSNNTCWGSECKWMREGHTLTQKKHSCHWASTSASKNRKVIIQFLSTFQVCYYTDLMGSGTPGICLKIWNWMRKVWWIRAEKIQGMLRGKGIILCAQSILCTFPLPYPLFQKD